MDELTIRRRFHPYHLILSNVAIVVIALTVGCQSTPEAETESEEPGTNRESDSPAGLSDSIGGTADDEPTANIALADASDSSCPDESDGYDYVYDDPATCAANEVECDHAGLVPFENECGCGCQHTGYYCAPWDIRTEGTCESHLGWGYDGEDCVSYSGCNCRGDDCRLLTSSREDCRKHIRDCDYNCGNPDGPVLDVYFGPPPSTCPDGSAYTVIGGQPLCVDPQTCERLEPSTQ